MHEEERCKPLHCVIARLEIAQRMNYSSHKGYHGIKFQAVVTSGGLISSLYGLKYGPVGDWKMWKDCGIQEILQCLVTSEQDIRRSSL